MLYAIEDLHGEFTYMLHLCCSQLWHDIARACCGDEMTCNMGDRMMSDVFPVPIARYTALPCMCIGQAFTYPCVHSFTHLSMCSFKHSLIHACDYLFMYLFIHLSMCSFIHSLIHVFIQAFTYPCIRLSFHVFIHSLIHVLIHLFGQALWCCCVGLCRAKARSVGSSLQETTPSLQKCEATTYMTDSAVCAEQGRGPEYSNSMVAEQWRRYHVGDRLSSQTKHIIIKNIYKQYLQKQTFKQTCKPSINTKKEKNI